MPKEVASFKKECLDSKIKLGTQQINMSEEIKNGSFEYVRDDKDIFNIILKLPGGTSIRARESDLCFRTILDLKNTKPLEETKVWIISGSTGERTGGDLGYCTSQEQSDKVTPEAGWMNSAAYVKETPAFMDECGAYYVPIGMKLKCLDRE